MNGEDIPRPIAKALVDCYNRLDQVWTLAGCHDPVSELLTRKRYQLPPTVSLTASVVQHALEKCLRQGGWDVRLDLKKKRLCIVARKAGGRGRGKEA